MISRLIGGAFLFVGGLVLDYSTWFDLKYFIVGSLLSLIGIYLIYTATRPVIM